jgi:hypothetical protein
MHMRVVYADGSVFEPEGVGSRGSVSSSGVRLEFDHGKVVSAQTDGAELNRSPEATRRDVDAIVEDIIAIDQRRRPELYYKAAPVPATEEQNRRAWK